LNTDPLLLQWTSVQQDFSNVLHGQFSRIENDNHSDAWFGCQNRRTEAKGDACQFHMVDTDIRRMEVQEQIVNTGTEIFFAPNDIPDHLSLSYLGPKGWRNVIHKIENVQKAHPGGAFIALPSTMMELRDDYYSALSGNPEYEQSALVAHENFVRSLSPEGKKFVTGFAESYKKASSAPPSQPNLALSPSARKDSRPSARTAIPPLPIKKEGAEAAKPKPLTSPANKVRTAGFSAGT
ncbi:MAG TPA: hypothetical protein VMV79_07530, partial [Alphaproteobacteria bacterium]|nr:hypothetical protein [Alphaproteobacteria bacterium]